MLVEKKNRKGTRYFENEAGEIVAKECRNCMEVKELADFNRNKGMLGGRNSECRICHNTRNAEHYEANKESYIKRAAEWCRENPEKVAASAAKWYEENKERHAAWVAKWQRDNPDKVRLKDQRRRARKKVLPDTLTKEQYAETMAYFGNACALTGETTELHMEHAIPISIGHGGTTAANCYPMCERLNLSKFNRNIFEWHAQHGERLAIDPERFDRLIGFLADMNDMSAEEYREYVDYCHANINDVLAQ